jgi:hypothetical protein
MDEPFRKKDGLRQISCSSTICKGFINIDAVKKAAEAE